MALEKNLTSNNYLHRVNYLKLRYKEDLFYDRSLLDPNYMSQHNNIEVKIQKIIKRGTNNGLSGHERKQFSDVVQEFKDIFKKTFSSGTPANV